MTPHFTRAEVECRCGCGMVPTPEFMHWLEKVRCAYGSPMRITSGARCAKHNALIGGAAHSAHVMGCAVDVHADGPSAYRLTGVAKLWGATGIGMKLHGPREKWHVHLDLAPRETQTQWTYP